jgi:TatD DNase family protein
MAIIDVHAHLDHAWMQENLKETLKRAREARVNAIISNGVNPETNRKTLELAEQYKIIKAALGIYPVDALAEEIKQGDFPLTKPNVFDVDEEIAFIKKNKNKIVAIGEVGLDNHTLPGMLNKQKKVFEKLITLAEQTKKPIIVHSRKAEQEVIDLLASSSIKNNHIVMHCFGGKLSLAKQVRDKGWFLSIPPSIVRSSHFQRIVEEVPLNQLLTETDSPYLSPFKDKRNEPAFITETIKKIAEIKQFTKEEVENNLFLNAKKLFDV